MGKHVSVLEKTSQTKLFTTRTPGASPEHNAHRHRAYAELAVKLFGGISGHSIVAFISVHSGEGVTRTVRGLAAELAYLGKTVVSLDGALRPVSGIEVVDAEFERGPTILGAPLAVESIPTGVLIPQFRDQYDSYDCILIDCGALDSSADLLRLAPVTDRVVLVVEAGRTRKEQIERAAKVIREAKGTLIGCVLNKRRYPIPGWLYRLL